MALYLMAFSTVTCNGLGQCEQNIKMCYLFLEKEKSFRASLQNEHAKLLSMVYFQICTGCMSPLGLENYMISDDQISASSFTTDKEHTWARLHYLSAWRSFNGLENHWIQVDFEKVNIILFKIKYSIV